MNDAGGTEEEPLRPGRTYIFELSFTNPLYEPISVRTQVARPIAQGGVEGAPAPFAVSSPTMSFPISAYAEEWEYEDDDDGGRDEEEDEVEGGDSLASPFKKKRGSKYGAGIVERKMNRTTVALEVAIGRETVGPIRVSSGFHSLLFLLVSDIHFALDRPACSSPLSTSRRIRLPLLLQPRAPSKEEETRTIRNHLAFGRCYRWGRSRRGRNQDVPWQSVAVVLEVACKIELRDELEQRREGSGQDGSA